MPESNKVRKSTRQRIRKFSRGSEITLLRNVAALRKNPSRLKRASKHRPINPRGDLKATGGRTWSVDRHAFIDIRIEIHGVEGDGGKGELPKGAPLGDRGFLRDREGITKDYMKILLSS